MVTNVATLGRSGVHDFILVRASGIILALYTFFLVGFIATTPSLTYGIWVQLFSAIPMKVFTLLTLVALLIHAWIGTWQVLTDYIKNIALRGILQFIFIIIAFSYMAAGFVIVWGV